MDVSLTPSIVHPYDALEGRAASRLMPSLFQRVRERFRAFVNRDARQPVSRVASARLPTEFGEFDIHVYESPRETHVALVRGNLGDGHDVLCRVHSSCVTGDIFHSERCDCGPQLQAALERIASERRGVLIYLNQEGRGIGLANKIRAYKLQEQGADTVEANERLGFPADLRDYRAALEMLRDLGVRSVRLMSNNPRKLEGLAGDGLAVNERLPIEIAATAASQHYLRTKKDKLGHMLSSI
jgi:3,4-dihydroxy 2-butanone 4-phosphate synthase/GTP cyclohydrolase II